VEVRDAIYAALQKVLSSANITYIKWDMNRSLSEVWSAALPSDRQGEVYHRNVLGVYELLERFRRDYPQILIEGCCGGGGRFDGGMLYYTPQIWCSDNTDAVDRLRIQYGTSFAYPVSAMGSHVSAVPNEITRRVTPLATRGVVAMSGAFGYELDLSKVTPEEREEMKEQIATYQEHFELIHFGDYYRLTDPFQEGPFTAWEQVSEDRREALVSLVGALARGNAPFHTLRLKGLDPTLSYRVNGGETSYPGDVLMQAGYPIPLQQGDYPAMQLYLKAE
jgi:alpha-galactosidase